MFAAWECMLRGPPGHSCEGQRYCDLNRAINISACWPVGGDVNDLWERCGSGAETIPTV